MMIKRTVWLAVLPLALAACGGGDETEVAEGGMSDTSTVTSMPAPAADTGMAMGGTDSAAMGGAGMQPIPLQAVGGAPVSGTVAITEAAGATQVVLTVSGAPGAGTHAAHVHTGTCDSPGGVVAPLESVTVDAGGAGTSTSTVQVPMATVMNGQHIVAVHEAGGDPGSPIACAAIPQHSM